MNRIVTRLPIGNHKATDDPSAIISWTARDDWEGWEAKMAVLDVEGKTQERKWACSVGLTLPAEHLTIMIEPVSGGCWRHYTLPASDITVQTLWMASTLLLEAVQSHPYWINPHISKDEA